MKMRGETKKQERKNRKKGRTKGGGHNKMERIRKDVRKKQTKN